MRLSLILVLIGLLAFVGAPSVIAAHPAAPVHRCADCPPHPHHGGADMAAPCPHPGLCLVASVPARIGAGARAAPRRVSFDRHHGDPALPVEPSPRDRPPRA